MTDAMAALQIVVEHMTKTFQVVERPEGLWATFRSLARRQYHTVEAVRDVRLTIALGETIALLGPIGSRCPGKIVPCNDRSSWKIWRYGKQRRTIATG